MAAQYRYGPWGELEYEAGSVQNPIRYTGREWDPETGLYFYRARYYDPQVGRFVSEDPIGLAGGINVFAYALSDPVNRRDPSGLYPVWFCFGSVQENRAEDAPGLPCFLGELDFRYETRESLFGSGAVSGPRMPSGGVTMGAGSGHALNIRNASGSISRQCGIAIGIAGLQVIADGLIVSGFMSVGGMALKGLLMREMGAMAMGAGRSMVTQGARQATTAGGRITMGRGLIAMESGAGMLADGYVLSGQARGAAPALSAAYGAYVGETNLSGMAAERAGIGGLNDAAALLVPGYASYVAARSAVAACRS